MNTTKAQKEIFNAMLKHNRVAKFEVDERSVFITPDGFHGFVIPLADIQVNLEKLKSMHKIDLQAIVHEDNLCKLSNECVIDGRPGRKEYFRKLKNDKFNVYISEKFLSCFQNPKFYATSSTSSVVVTEDIFANRGNAIVGLICPVRILEEEIF